MRAAATCVTTKAIDSFLYTEGLVIVEECTARYDDRSYPVGDTSGTYNETNLEQHEHAGVVPR
jgi:hypothetical protein